MPKIITVHSFRRGAGKSMLTANLATLLAASGQRVGTIDADVLSPSLHWQFGLGEVEMEHSFNEYLFQQIDIESAARDITESVGPSLKGKLFLVPASDDAQQISRVLHENYEVDRLIEGGQRLIKHLNLDTLFIDTPAGLNQDSLAVMAMADHLLIALRLDKQDYQGTAVMVDVGRRLEAPHVSLIVNMVPAHIPAAEVAVEAAQTYQCPVLAVLPDSDELLAHSNAGIFAVTHPHHPITATLKQTADKLAL